jgi:hypothetical protein
MGKCFGVWTASRLENLRCSAGFPACCIADILVRWRNDLARQNHIPKLLLLARSADEKICDTADKNVCATGEKCFF